MKLAAFPWLCVGREAGGGRLSVVEWLDLAAECRLDGIELPAIWCGPTDDRAYVRSFRDHLAGRGLAVGMYTLAVDNWIDPASLATARRLVDFAAELGTTRLRMLTQRWQPQIKEISPVRAIRVSVEALARVAEMAEPAGIHLAVENHHEHIGTETAHFVQIMNGLPQPNVGCNLDPKHPVRVGEDVMSFVRHPKVLGRIKCAHLDNFSDTVDGWNRTISLDEGDLDLVPVLAAIKSSGYDDWLSMEYGGTDPAKIKRSVDWVRRTWDQV